MITDDGHDTLLFPHSAVNTRCAACPPPIPNAGNRPEPFHGEPGSGPKGTPAHVAAYARRTGQDVPSWGEVQP